MGRNAFAWLACAVIGLGAPGTNADWSSVTGFDGLEVTDLFVSRDTLYVATPGAVHIHPAGSAAWSPTAPLGEGIEISQVIKVGGRLFAGTYGHGVYESVNNGQTWQPRSAGLSGLGSLAIMAFAVRGDSLYAGTGGAAVWVFNLNGGGAWQTFRDGLGFTVSWDSYSLHAWGRWLLLGAGQNAYIHRNPAGSGLWTGVEYTPFSAGGEAMWALADHDGALYGAASGGLFVSPDSGLTWTPFFGPWRPSDHGAVAATDRAVIGILSFLSHGTYVYLREGDSWTQIEHLAGVAVHDAVVFDNRVYLAHFAGLLYQPLAPTTVPEPAPRPGGFALHQNFPNQFNPATVIAYDLPSAADVNLSIYDLLGRHVATLVDSRRPAGHHRVVWQTADPSGTRLPSGVYLYRLVADDRRITRKMLLLK